MSDEKNIGIVRKLIAEKRPIWIKRSSGRYQKGLVTAITPDGDIVTVEWTDPGTSDQLIKQAYLKNFIEWQKHKEG